MVEETVLLRTARRHTAFFVQRLSFEQFQDVGVKLLVAVPFACPNYLLDEQSNIRETGHGWPMFPEDSSTVVVNFDLPGNLKTGSLKSKIKPPDSRKQTSDLHALSAS